MKAKRTSRKELYKIINSLGVSELQSKLIFQKVFVTPSISQWRLFADKILLALGAGFFASGIIFFFAYNWSELHRYSKLSIIASSGDCFK